MNYVSHFLEVIELSDLVGSLQLLLVFIVGYYAVLGIKLTLFPESPSAKSNATQNAPRGRQKSAVLPRKVFMVRHGQSLGNVEMKAYTTTPDWAVPLTSKGKQEAFMAGVQIKEQCGDTPIVVYFSPYKRTKETMKQILRSFPQKQIYLVQQEPRIREQDFGNFQDYERINLCKRERLKFSRFFYRFPMGESGADVYDRVSSFMESLFRLFQRDNPKDYNLIIVSHGLTIRVILMRWFRWTVQEFETLVNPVNATPIIMERKQGSNTKYHLTQNSWSMLHSESALNKVLESRASIEKEAEEHLLLKNKLDCYDYVMNEEEESKGVAENDKLIYKDETKFRIMLEKHATDGYEGNFENNESAKFNGKQDRGYSGESIIYDTTETPTSNTAFGTWKLPKTC